jgi:hypothetical protein
MTRKDLEDLGLSKEQVDSVIKINGIDIENAKTASTSEIKNLQTENTGLKTQISDRDKQLETLKASTGDAEVMKTQIADLQKANTDAAATHESEMNQLKIDFAVEKVLNGANAKNVKAVKALLDLTDSKLDKDGNVKGLQEQIDKLTADEGTKFLFEVPNQTQTQQTFTGFQPGTSTTVPNSTQAGYETRLAEARKNGNQLEVIKIKQEAFETDGTVLM